MIIDHHILDALTAQAKESQRLRMNIDLRYGPEDLSRRMLNSIELGTISARSLALDYHRDGGVLAGCFVEHFYDENRRLTETIDMGPGEFY